MSNVHIHVMKPILFLHILTLGRVITGASIGVIAVAVLLGLFVFFLHRQLKKKKENRNVVPEKKW